MTQDEADMTIAEKMAKRRTDSRYERGGERRSKRWASAQYVKTNKLRRLCEIFWKDDAIDSKVEDSSSDSHDEECDNEDLFSCCEKDGEGTKRTKKRKRNALNFGSVGSAFVQITTKI